MLPGIKFIPIIPGPNDPEKKGMLMKDRLYGSVPLFILMVCLSGSYVHSLESRVVYPLPHQCGLIGENFLCDENTVIVIPEQASESDLFLCLDEQRTVRIHQAFPDHQSWGRVRIRGACGRHSESAGLRHQ